MSTVDHALEAVRTVKHSAFVARKQLRRAVHPVLQGGKDLVLTALDTTIPFTFDARRFPESFLARDIPMGEERTLERAIYCFWTGDNDLTPNRVKSLERMQEVSDDIEIRLVKPDNLRDYILPDVPLHPAYENLSLVHRSDYLRSYFMNFYGGGYIDIKPMKSPWGPAFDRLEAASGAWVLGYPEIASDMTIQTTDSVGRAVRRHYSLIAGNCGFVMKAQTPLTREWYAELLSRMDYYSRRLELAPGDTRGDNPGYPVPWHGILGNILPPLMLKYHRRVIQDDLVRPEFEDYQ